MDRRGFLVAAGTVGFAGCLGSASSDYDVGMSASAFLPERLTIEVGDSVVWKNTGSRAHTVTAYEALLPDGAVFFATGAFATQREAVVAWSRSMGGAISTGETFEHTFDVAGRHPYYCIPHELGGMLGDIIVE